MSDPSAKAPSAEPTRTPPAPPEEPGPATLPPPREAAEATIPPLYPTASSEAARAGKSQVPGYDILGELGRGGMGVVYQARQVRLQRLVALKMILAGAHAGHEALERFRTEAETVARMQHPHIVQIHEVGEHEGLPYFSLEFCPGGSLEKKLLGTPLPPREAAALVEKLARATHAAHEKGIIHRDLKPANVLLSEDGTPKITDFGLAKKLDAAGYTASGAVMGTPSYMAPEQASGQNTALGPACDVYALGAILYECLTGRPPFRAATPLDTILQVVRNEPLLVTQLNNQVPGDLETICHKCLQKDPGKRYATAEALADDLGRFLRDEPIKARPVGRLERVAKWVRRNPIVAGLAAGLVSVLLAGTTAATLFALDARRQAKEASEARDTARQQAGAARRGEYGANMLLTQAAWEQNQVDRVLALLRDQVPRPGEEDLRGFEWFYWSNQVLRGHFNLGEHIRTVKSGTTTSTSASTVTSVAYSPDGQRLASGSGVRTVKVWDALNGQELLTLQGHTDTVTSVAYSPDGQRLASASADQTVRIWDGRTGQELRTLRGHTRTVTSVAYSPDGQRLASTSMDQTVRVWDAATGQALHTLRGHDAWVTSVAYSPDGQGLASSSGDGKVKVWDAASGRDTLTLAGHTSQATSVAYRPDGKCLASGSRDGTVKIWDAASGRELHTLRGHQGAVNSVAYSPDGKRLASGSADTTLRVWDAEKGAVMFTLRGHKGEVSSVAYSPDGKRLASGHFPRVTVWDAVMGQEPLLLSGHSGRVTSVAYSRKGQLLLSGSTDRTVKVWNVRTGLAVLTLRGHTNTVTSVAFRSDGGRLATGSTDGTVKVWDAASGQTLHTLRGHEGGVTSVAYSPDGQCLASSGGRTVKVWDAASGRELLALPRHSGTVTSIAYSPDGQQIVTTGDMLVRVWDAVTGERLLTLQGDVRDGQSVVYSPDGKRLACCLSGSLVKVWDARSGRDLFTLEGHTGMVIRVVYSPDGKRLASSSMDGTVKIWDAESGRELLTFQGPRDGVTSVAYSADSRQLASGGADGTVTVWEAEELTPENQLARMAERLTLSYGRDAEEAFRKRDWPRALTSATRAIELGADDAVVWSRRAMARANLGDWRQAASDYARAIERGASSYAIWYHHALIRARLGDAVGHRQACTEALRRFAATDDPATALWISHACIVAPDAVADPGAVVRLAEKALPKDPRQVTFLQRWTLGGALYRAGQLVPARQQLEQARQLLGDAALAERDALLLALVHRRLGHVAEAKQWRLRAEQWWQANQDRLPPTWTWNNRLEMELLLQEVQRVLDGQPATASQTDS